MPEIIDLSQEIYAGMPVFKGLPDVKMEVHVTHEAWEGIENPKTATPAVYRLELSEHSGTHVDSLSHMAAAYCEQTIDTMPLSMFYTRGLCLDVSHRGLQEFITTADIEQALSKDKLTIQKGDTVLLYTDHYRRHYGTSAWPNGPGITVEAARWLGHQGIAAFGVETLSPGIPKQGNKEVHHIGGEMGYTHYENLINLHLLVGRGYFRFIAFPLKIRGGTGSPVRAVAVFE
ncbi:cyclase family protein [Flavobacterium silvisoli]|uniref:Cyclase family protein n=1 Tax=Flavobacterium silvisoli TaxID=2529433 RepID=A0A4V6N086_9FLAO|nr:cyclase family protein [Flavobacterium silvisoli]TBX65164.1 cyclase family protein [Flavobacterium silvisoli]